MIKKARFKYILAITGDGVIHGADENNSHLSFDKESASGLDRPDAWIYDLNNSPPEVNLHAWPRVSQYSFLALDYDFSKCALLKLKSYSNCALLIFK